MRRLAGLVALLLALPRLAMASSLSIGIQLEPPILDPTLSPAASIAEVVVPQVFQGLVQIGPNWMIQPALALSWQVSPDGLTYRFSLRPNVRFQDGTQFTAADVQYSLGRAIQPGSVNPQADRLGVISAIDTPDPLTVVLHLKRPSYGLLQVLGLPAAVIVAPNSEPNNLVHPVGTGPFKLLSWQRGYQITLVRNPDYWGKAPNVSQVTYRVIADPNAALDALLTGDVDAYDAFPAPESVARLRQDKRFVVEEAPSELKTILAINNRLPPFNNLLVRQALSFAIDRQAIIDAAAYGLGTPIGSHFSSLDKGYVDLTGVYAFNPARARALLAQAGYPHGFDTVIVIPPLAYAARSAEIIAAELADVGVRAKIQQLDWAPWLTQVFGAHQFSLTVVAHVEPIDYNIYGNPHYYFGYDNANYRAVLQQLDTTGDPAKRLALLGQLQRTISADAVNAFLFQWTIATIINARVQNLWLSTPLRDIDPATAIVTGGPVGGGVASLDAVVLGWGMAALALLAAILILWRTGWRFAARRGLSLLATLLVSSVVIFGAMQIVPGDPARAQLGSSATPGAVAALRAQLGLNAPLAARYLHWLAGLLHGDFGVSWSYHAPVAQLLAQRLCLSLPLTVYALLISTVLALGLGVGAVYFRGRALGSTLGAVSRLGLAVPNFWFGQLLIVPLAIGLHWFSAGGFPGWSAGLGAGLRALTLPAFALALPQAAVLARVLQNELLELEDQEFLRTARAKGFSRLAVLWRHALPNAAIPVLTILGMQFSFLLAGSILIENVFFLPGLGRLIFQAIGDRDLITVQAVAIVLVAQVVLVTLLADLAAAAVDPRLRRGTQA